MPTPLPSDWRHDLEGIIGPFVDWEHAVAHMKAIADSAEAAQRSISADVMPALERAHNIIVAGYSNERGVVALIEKALTKCALLIDE